jgi:transcription initiation factor IIE alpha subunit
MTRIIPVSGMDYNRRVPDYMRTYIEKLIFQFPKNTDIYTAMLREAIDDQARPRWGVYTRWLRQVCRQLESEGVLKLTDHRRYHNSYIWKKQI